MAKRASILHAGCQVGRWVSITTAILASVACASERKGLAGQPQAATPKGGEATSVFYYEAPCLAESVSAGKLPPVEKRLPRNPMIVQPIERVGEHGGTCRSALLDGRDYAWLDRTLGCEHLARWDEHWTRVIPNIAESFAVNADATLFTFRLRRGMRWSDGPPFTADDIMFWYDGVFMASELGFSGLDLFYAGGKPVVATKVDDFTVSFRFETPNGLFLSRLAGWNGVEPTACPLHYLGKYHPRYNPEGVAALVAEAGLGDWRQLFRKHVGHESPGYEATKWRNAALPTLNAWQLVVGYAQGEVVEARRNPCYWKIDIAGNQFPYIDRVVFLQPRGEQALLDLALRGGLDLYDRQLTTLANRPALEAGKERGGYRLYRIIDDSANTIVVSLNLTHRDPEKRRLFQDKNFRIGASLPPEQYGLAHVDLRNVPEVMVRTGAGFLSPAAVNPCQF